ncbi:MAG: hypothetical protein LAO78_20740 [Acidobacteriia bacterium]|nr:hypothetical protein [Terriglobia bacterium]
MAVIESKRSVSPAQPRAHKPRKSNKQTKVPASLRFTETTRGKTVIRRYDGRTFYRFHDVKGKTIDFVEVFVCAGYNCVDIRFDDKTALTFAIEPAFTLETEHADWKTGDWRPIKRWPLIHSESHRLKG